MPSITEFLGDKKGITFNFLGSQLFWWTCGFPVYQEFQYDEGHALDGSQPSGHKGSGVVVVSFILAVIATFVFLYNFTQGVVIGTDEDYEKAKAYSRPRRFISAWTFVTDNKGAMFNFVFSQLFFWLYGYPNLSAGFDERNATDGSVPSGWKGSGVAIVSLLLMTVASMAIAKKWVFQYAMGISAEGMPIGDEEDWKDIRFEFRSFSEFLGENKGITFNFIFSHVFFWYYAFDVFYRVGYGDTFGDDGSVESGPNGKGIVPILGILTVIATCVFILNVASQVFIGKRIYKIQN